MQRQTEVAVSIPPDLPYAFVNATTNVTLRVATAWNVSALQLNVHVKPGWYDSIPPSSFLFCDC